MNIPHLLRRPDYQFIGTNKQFSNLDTLKQLCKDMLGFSGFLTISTTGLIEYSLKVRSLLVVHGTTNVNSFSVNITCIH